MEAEGLDEIWGRLLASRCRPADVPAIDQTGIYALFLAPGAALPDVVIDSSGLLYVGMTASSLAERNHLTHEASGFSSPRRSFGALLKQELDLHAVPRSPGPSASNIRSFSFTAKGERRLTDWMTTHLEYGFAVVENEIEHVEDELIARQRAPLNLKGWRNPQAAHIKALRGLCRDEAARARSRAQT